EGDGAETAEAVVAGEVLGQAHVLQLSDGPRRQPVAARLLAGEALLLDEEHVVTGPRQPVRTGRPGRPSPHDQDVVGGGHYFKPSRSNVTTFLICSSVRVPLNGGMTPDLATCWPPARAGSP